MPKKSYAGDMGLDLSCWGRIAEGVRHDDQRGSSSISPGAIGAEEGRARAAASPKTLGRVLLGPAQPLQERVALGAFLYALRPRRVISALVGTLLVAVLVAVFAFQNGDPVVVRFFHAELHVSLGLALTLSAAAGMIAGLLVCAGALVKKSLTISKLRKRAAAGESTPAR